MKLEKREVTLNEKDSLKDMLVCERALLMEYAALSPTIEGEERRNDYEECFDKTLQNVFYVADLLYEKAKQGIKH